MSTALVLVTHAASFPDDVSRQALAFAAGFATPADTHAVMIGSGASAASAAELGSNGAGTVHLAEHTALDSFAPDAWSRIVVDLADRVGADVIVGAGSEVGNDVLARVAARMGVPFAANCLAGGSGDPASVTRCRWGGSLIEDAHLHGGRAVFTVAPHAIAAAETGGEAAVTTFTPELAAPDLIVRVRQRVGVALGGISLSDARVVISGGRGVGSTQGFAPIEDLARLLGAAVGCTRAVTIAGWRAHTDQIGQTGTRIAPEVYIACGVSGAIQHMVGCRGAKLIVAINSDREAPIMRSADYSVVGNLAEVVPAIAAEIRRVRETRPDG